MSVRGLCRAVGVSRAGYYRQSKHGGRSKSGSGQWRSMIPRQCLAIHFVREQGLRMQGNFALDPDVILAIRCLETDISR